VSRPPVGHSVRRRTQRARDEQRLGEGVAGRKLDNGSACGVPGGGGPPGLPALPNPVVGWPMLPGPVAGDVGGEDGRSSRTVAIGPGSTGVTAGPIDRVARVEAAHLRRKGRSRHWGPEPGVLLIQAFDHPVDDQRGGRHAVGRGQPAQLLDAQCGEPYLEHLGRAETPGELGLGMVHVR